MRVQGPEIDSSYIQNDYLIEDPLTVTPCNSSTYVTI